MAKHWTEYMQGEATKAQCDLHDLLANQANEALDAMSAAGCDLGSTRRLADGRAVLEWCMVKGAPTKAEASRVIDRAKEKIAARWAKVNEAKTAKDPRAAAIEQIRALMAQHNIAVTDL